MSYVTIRYLYCDGGDGCPYDGSPFSNCPNPKLDTIARQRIDARNCDGWLVSAKDGKDYCSECRKKLKEPDGKSIPKTV